MVQQLTYGSLFTGIGGLDLGLDQAGMTCRWQVEIDQECRNVLQKHWPDIPKFGDIKNINPSELDPVELVCGGFPCQPHSVAGQRRGSEDDRDLWPEFFRIVKSLRPRWILGENVPGIRHTILDQIISDLEGIDYTTTTIDLPAIAFGASHIRMRTFIIAAHANGAKSHVPRLQNSAGQTCLHRQRHPLDRQQRPGPSTADHLLPPHLGRKNRASCTSETRSANGQQSTWETQSQLDRTTHGFPCRMDRHRANTRLRMLGNAVCPPVAKFLGQLIIQTDERFYQHGKQ